MSGPVNFPIIPPRSSFGRHAVIAELWTLFHLTAVYAFGLALVNLMFEPHNETVRQTTWSIWLPEAISATVIMSVVAYVAAGFTPSVFTERMEVALCLVFVALAAFMISNASPIREYPLASGYEFFGSTMRFFGAVSSLAALTRVAYLQLTGRGR